MIMRSLKLLRGDRRYPRLQVRGFTLIEVMVAVACIAILAAVAMPNYSEHVRKARRTDAKNAVLELAGRQARFYSINNRYAKVATELGYAALPASVQGPGGSHYELSVGFDSSGKTYTAKATPTGAQTKDLKCYTYLLTHTGAQSNVDAADNALSSASCW